MENCPEEAIKNNIFGTYNVAMASKKYNVEKFVLISTDKAVNPTNIMGASKSFCEQILQGLRNDTDTIFSAVRFGNVICSKGSVIPLFKKQIQLGGPITITDKRIIRYFMTIPEAVQLVLLAGNMAKSGEIYVLDMGKPIKIYDIAKKLIKLYGLIPYKDIDIEEIGLRDGEKLYEELLINNNNLYKTENNKIFVEYQNKLDLSYIENAIWEFKLAIEKYDRNEIINILRKYVPTFSNPNDINELAPEKIKSLLNNKKI